MANCPTKPRFFFWPQGLSYSTSTLSNASLLLCYSYPIFNAYYTIIEQFTINLKGKEGISSVLQMLHFCKFKLKFLSGNVCLPHYPSSKYAIWIVQIWFSSKGVRLIGFACVRDLILSLTMPYFNVCLWPFIPPNYEILSFWVYFWFVSISCWLGSVLNWCIVETWHLLLIQRAR